MKIGILSDTHVPTLVPALPPIIYDIFHGVDLILHAGDIVELTVLDDLRAIAPVEAVAGNVDSAEVQARLPFKKVISIGKFTLGLIHGKYKLNVQQEMIRKEFGNVDLIVYGHSHYPFWGVREGVYFLNPGSPTDKRHAPFNSVALLELGDDVRAEIVRI